MSAKPIKNKDILVICIDRDNDLGRKAGVSGPIVGMAANIDAAVALGLKDPSDSDLNAIFYALKVCADLKVENKVEVVTLLGDENIGIVSDRKILAQLEEVLKTHSFKVAVLVSDGAGDERILPLLKTKIDVISTQQVIVKQSARLESTYYMINDFVIDAFSNRKTAQLFFGIPAAALIIYALYGMAAWRFILGFVGIYLFIRGFHLEQHIHNILAVVSNAAKKRQPSIFLYILSVSALIIAFFQGYRAAVSASNILEETLIFINSSIFLLLVAVVLSLWGRAMSLGKEQIPAYATYTMLSFASAWIVYELTRFVMTPAIGYAGIAYSVLISGVLVAISTLIERRIGGKRNR